MGHHSTGGPGMTGLPVLKTNFDSLMSSMGAPGWQVLLGSGEGKSR